MSNSLHASNAARDRSASDINRKLGIKSGLKTLNRIFGLVSGSESSAIICECESMAASAKLIPPLVFAVGIISPFTTVTSTAASLTFSASEI